MDDAGEVVGQAWYFNGNYPWLGMLFCAPIIGLWYWCTDQYIVQRALGAKNETHARRGSIFAVLPEAAAGVHLHHSRHHLPRAGQARARCAALAPLVDANGNAIAREAQAAFPLMVKHVLPEGVRGAVVAGLLAALMSSLAGAFNASSTLFTIDLYQEDAIRNASDSRLVWVGRMATVVMTVIALDLDSRDPQCAARLVRLSAGHPGLPGAADLRRVLPGRILEAAQRGRLHGRARRRLPDGHVPTGGRHADHARRRRIRERLHAQIRSSGSSTTSTSSTTAC